LVLIGPLSIILFKNQLPKKENVILKSCPKFKFWLKSILIRRNSYATVSSRKNSSPEAMSFSRETKVIDFISLLRVSSLPKKKKPQPVR
jgi:hypothetical protein